MSAPALTVELLAVPIGPLFGNPMVLGTGKLDDANLSGPNEWVDISAHVRAVDVNRGNRSRDLDAFRAGTAAVVLDNRARQFDPTNDGADLAGNIVPSRRLRITATPEGGAPVTLFVGRVESWRIDWRANSDSTATATCTDGLAVLASQALDEAAPVGAGETVGARVARVLDLPEVAWPAADRDLEAGNVTLAAYTGGANAAAYLQDAAASEGGALFVAADGTLTYRGRNLEAAPVATFTDRSGGPWVPYVDASLLNDAELLFNRVRVVGDGHADALAEDVDSQLAFDVRALERTTLLDDDGDALGLAQWLLARFASPQIRFGQVEVMLASLTAAQQATVLALELADGVAILRDPPGAGTPAAIDQRGTVDSLRWSIRPGNRWRLSVALSASQVFGLILDDPDRGQLDDDTLA